ncbi:MAG: hypothetical protein HY238_20555 [Acidobacteria bacterium]|nr:hypothetical protein [Acidobacteriota bacterium]
MNGRELTLVMTVAAAGGMLGGAAAVRLLVGTPVLAQEKRAKVIEAEEFRLVESDGKPCGRFHVDKSGRPALFLFDKHGEVRAVLGVMPNGSPHLALSDKDGKVRVALAVWPDERSGLFVSDKKDTPRATVAVLADGKPSLFTSDQDGKIRSVLGATSVDMIPSTEVRNRSESALALFGPEGKLLWSAP